MGAREMFDKLRGEPHYLRHSFVCSGGRGRRLPVAIVLRFDRVGRREPAPTELCHTFRLVVGDGVPDIPMWFCRIKCISIP